MKQSPSIKQIFSVFILCTLFTLWGEMGILWGNDNYDSIVERLQKSTGDAVNVPTLYSPHKAEPPSPAVSPSNTVKSQNTLSTVQNKTQEKPPKEPKTGENSSKSAPAPVTGPTLATAPVVDTPAEKPAATTSTVTHTEKRKSIHLFGTIEFKGALKNLVKWSGLLAKMKAWQGYTNDPKTKGLKSIASWNRLKKEIASSSTMAQIKAVNKYFNKWPYRLDINNYGKRDYWASPPEFLRKSGDCEDYAIAKFYALKELGFTGKTMRVVALKDTIRNIGHAVLAVYIDDDIYILDNQTNLVLSHKRYGHYRPYYSVNETHRWMHVPPMKK